MGIAWMKVCDASFRCVMGILSTLKKSQICNFHHEPNSDAISTYLIPTKYSIHYEFNTSEKRVLYLYIIFQDVLALYT